MAELIKQLTQKNSDVLDVASKFTVEELESAINFAADKYYNTSKSVISDAVYDILIDFLKLKSPKSSVLKNIGAKVKTKNKVTLDYWLGSMDKIKPPQTNQLNIWTKKYKKPYNFSDKLDGVSALLIYRENGSINMYTRGTATEGTDITHLVKYLDLPTFENVKKYCTKNKISGDSNLIAFRGELIIKESVFQKRWSKTLKNGRNSVAGLVNSKTINPELATDTDLVLYEVVDPFYPIEKQLKITSDIGFNTVTNKMIDSDLSFESLSKYLKERRSKSDYQIDGIIVTSMGKHDRNVDGNPEYAFAFKDILEDQMAKSIVEKVEWKVSKDGFINPTVLFKPVNIGGVEIKRATGFNAKFIVDNVLGPGAEIELIRSGDVIPYIKNVLKPAKSGKPDMPDVKYVWNKNNIDILIDDVSSNQDVKLKNIYFFFSTLDTKGLGEKNIEKIVDSGLDTIPKILAATHDDFLDVEGFKEKTAQNLVESIKKSVTNIPLSKLMAASNKMGPGLGEERMKQVLGSYPNIMTEYKKWSKQEFIDNIKKINSWEEKTATLLVSNFGDFIKFYDSVKKYITIEIKKKVTKGQFTDKTIVLTGFRDKELQEQIEAQGGKIGSSVSKNTDYLVVKDQETIDNPTDKISKATSIGVTIITKDKLIKMLK